jgi:uncharacterized membrane protein (DUF373 family)
MNNCKRTVTTTSIVRTFTRKILSGKDNQTPDVVRLLGALTIMVALGLTVFVVVCRNKDFDIQSFGIGIAAVFSAVGVALKLKETTEPAPTTISSEPIEVNEEQRKE